MKKLFIGSGILLALLVIMAFTGLTDRDNSHKAAFNEASLQYVAGHYDKAIELYKQATENVDKYLNSGNASFKLAEADKDDKEKLQFYQDALKTYKQGVLKFPENVALKYNYEYVLKKIGPQQQDQQDSDKNKDGQQPSPSPSPQPGDQDGQQPSPSPQPGDQDGQQPSPSPQPGGQDGQQSSPSPQPGDQNGQQPSPSAQPDKDSQQSSQDDGTSPSPGQTSSPSPGGESSSQSSELSDQELQQVMGMLEKQEEDSLKNNQEIKKEDKGEAYDW